MRRKPVRVAGGEVPSVALDLRGSSLTFGKWEGVRLSPENKRMRWTLPGFANRSQVTSEDADFLCKTTESWALEYDDAEPAITWPLEGGPAVFGKEAKDVAFASAETYF